MTGSLRLAKQIALCGDDDPVPKGWRQIAMGGSRMVYLGPDGIIYKVPYEGTYYSNIEVDWANRLRGHRSLWAWDIKVPPITSHAAVDSYGDYTLVNAMPYLPSQKVVKCACYKDQFTWTGRPCDCRRFGQAQPCFGHVWNVLEELGLEDVWEANLSYRNNYVWVIDLAEYSGMDDEL